MHGCTFNLSFLLCLSLSVAIACSDETEDAESPKDWASKERDRTDKGAIGDGDAIVTRSCYGKTYACGDGLDNDDDALIDALDPECTSPCDDNEGSFQTNLPGQNESCVVDCFFDDNASISDDTCAQNLQCDRKKPGAQINCGYRRKLACGEFPAPPSKTCLDTCLPLVPNGCDCFGCCKLGERFIYLDGNADCRLDNLAACRSCTFNQACANPCEGCELCFGQTIDQLPDECGGQATCPAGAASCTSHSDCPAEQFCQTGCCTPLA